MATGGEYHWKDATDIYVGHSARALRTSRTLRSLYIDPLVAILTHQNSPTQLKVANETVDMVGVFDADPGVSIGVVSRPVTVVVTGNAPFDQVIANSTYRDVFYDAPLEDVENDMYSVQNSHYASVSWRRAIGPQRLGGGWGTPSWPVSLRNDIWRQLMAEKVGVLNVDDLVMATRWDWSWYHIAGLFLCG
ncbi:hypothetical protein AYL99_11021 [Fonsecaea erecta]|uniref:Uncharacterized protein n=1 Tax=Fonsecaea erecta TaxID=1367422 RepID=A0A178Z5X5_9EURO|nr:hypothetical protein AYL99_11021 [Fonsecaea erecta]OAP54573.1 hypothetical protein AYL99_11021 [Fonsecaea erecta]